MRLASHLFRKVTFIAAGGALCVGLAATGTAASLAGTASSAQAGSFYPATGHSAGPALVSLARQAAVIRPLHRASLLVEVRLSAERAAAAKAAAKAAAERVAAARAAAKRAAVARAARARAAAAQVRLQRAAAARAEVRREIARRTLRTGSQSQTVDQTATVDSVTPTGTPQEIAAAMLAQRGWAGQFSCLDSLWEHESGWNVYAENPSSGAYGIAQALPGSQMASAGPDWQSSAATQIRWGLNYIQNRYGSPCGAWDHEEATGWY
ncbi:MAG TPA: lytic transglycosylase domain-containing protein [Trebonia sp.]|nr:lytic transglycosylase domain-containing protein [Trebonia sp.]